MLESLTWEICSIPRYKCGESGFRLSSRRYPIDQNHTKSRARLNPGVVVERQGRCPWAFLAVLRGPEWRRRRSGLAVSVHTGLGADVAFSLSSLSLSLSRGAPRYNGNVFSSNVLFVMSLMEESANAELQGRPGGARRYARSAAGERAEGSRVSERRRREGATRGPGSTSTHLNFGHSQGQCGRTTRPPSLPLSFSLFLSPPLSSLSVTSLDFFSSYSRVRDSLFLSFSRPLGPPRPLNESRTALSRHTVLGPTPSPVSPYVSLFFSFCAGQLTILRNPN